MTDWKFSPETIKRTLADLAHRAGHDIAAVDISTSALNDTTFVRMNDSRGNHFNISLPLWVLGLPTTNFREWLIKNHPLAFQPRVTPEEEKKTRINAALDKSMNAHRALEAAMREVEKEINS